MFAHANKSPDSNLSGRAVRVSDEGSIRIIRLQTSVDGGEGGCRTRSFGEGQAVAHLTADDAFGAGDVGANVKRCSWVYVVMDYRITF